MRLDKFLSVTGTCSRTDAKRAIRGKNVMINQTVAKTADIQVEPLNDEIFYFGKKVTYREYNYILMNKPAGVVSATEDGRDKTVLDLLPLNVRNDRMFPCGRLDKNTLGLVLITDNGDLAHELLSPKSHVDKKYRFCVENPILESDIPRIEEGLVLEDGYRTLPAKIDVFSDMKSGIITLTEGKYHQIKRMFISLGNKITYLERITFGPLTLDNSLQRGEWRYLTQQEIDGLKSHKSKIRHQI